jgi:pimeloyl-ACP methyl ester carboxylesterase
MLTVFGLAVVATSSWHALTEVIPRFHGQTLLQKFLFPVCKPQYIRNEVSNIHHCASNSPRLELTYLHIEPHLTRYDQKSPRYFFHYHGNGCNILDTTYFLYLLHSELEKHFPQHAWHIISTEYPGYCPDTYGQKVNEVEVQKHAVLSLKILVSTFAIASFQHVYIMGQSIGTGIATYVVSQIPSIAGVVLISAFTSIKDIVVDKLGEYSRFLVAERINNQKQLSAYSGPVLLIHGKLDTVILPKHATQLMEFVQVHGKASSVVVKWLETSGHNDMDRQTVFQFVISFVHTTL